MALLRRTRLYRESGFTLIDVLGVILILGIRAAFALPFSLAPRWAANDADAKSNARSLSSQVELCFAPEEDFRKCQTEADIGENLGIPYGPGDGEAQVTAATEKTYTIVARAAKPDENGVIHTFTIERDVAGTTNRTCTASNGNDNGGCNNGSW